MNNAERKTILIVEDEVIISIVITKTLKRFGYDVLSVTCGEDALRLAESNEAISLILMDIDLGSGIDGTETARRILALRDIPIVFHTSHSEREMVERVRGITRYGYVIKSSGDFVLQSSIEMAFELVESNRRIVENEVRTRTLVRSLPDLIWFKDKEGVYISCNEIFEKFFGAEESEIRGKTDYDFVSKELADFFKEHDRIAMSAGKPVVNEEWITFRSDGHRALLETIKTPVVDPAGQIIGVIGIGRDITERKMMEAQREAAIEALRVNESRLTMALDVGNAGIWEWNVEDDSVCFDARFHEMLGYSPGELPMDLDEWLTYHHDGDLPLMMARARGYLNGDTPGYESEHRIRAKSGEWNWVFTRGRIVKFSETGSPQLFIGIAINVTGRKLSEEEIRSKNEELRALNEELSASIEEMEASIEEAETINDDLNETNRALIEKENELKISMERMLILVDQASDGIFLMERNGRYVNVNSVFCGMLGYTAGELLGKNFVQTMRDDSGSAISAGHEEFDDYRIVIKKGVLTGKDGSVLPVEIRLKQLTNGLIQGIVHDLSSHRGAEPGLRREEDLFTAAVSAVDDGIWEWDIPGGNIFFSAQFNAITGYSSGEFSVSYDSLMNFIHPEDLSMVESDVKRSIDDRSKFYHDFRMRTKTGEWLWVSIRGRIVENDSEGKPVRAVGTFSDITQQKQRENELITNQSKLERIIENSSDLICEIDDAGRYTFVSKRYSEILGYTSDELVGKAANEKMHPDDLAAARERFNILKDETGTSVNEWRFMHKNGNYRYFECRGSAYKGEDGATRTVVISHDITEVKKTEDIQLFLITSSSLFSGEDFFRMLVGNLAQTLEVEYVSVGRLTGEGSSVKTVAVYYEGELDWDREYTLKDTPCGDSISRTICAIRENVRSLYPDNYILNIVGAESFAGIMLWSSTGKPIGIITAVGRKRIENMHLVEIILKMVSIRAAGELESRDAEEKIKKLLSEKEIILKEVHHRIKNNMNTVTGLLSLQAEAMDDPAAVEALNNARNRIYSMMVLYDKLYRSENFNDVSARDYLTSLIDEIIINFPNHDIIEVDKQIDDFVIEVKKLVPLGIIINELITNIMKYAFSGRDSGSVSISASKRGDNIIMIVRDNGVGIPEDINFNSSTGFGLQLVGMLADQLGGDIRIERGTDSRFILEFGI